MKPKIFGVGLSRTGTVSLTAALKRLGWNAVHYPHLFRVIELANQVDALTDTPVIVYMEALDRLYPDARFVLTVREEESWIDSLRRHYGRRPLSKIAPWKLWNRRAVYGVDGYNEALMRQVRADHEARVLRHFDRHPAELLVLDVCGGEGYERLCPFLGKRVLDEPFPHRNVGVPA